MLQNVYFLISDNRNEKITIESIVENLQILQMIVCFVHIIIYLNKIYLIICYVFVCLHKDYKMRLQ